MCEIILGIAVSILGVLILVSQALQKSKADDTFGKSTRYQLIVLGIGLVLGGIIWAIR